MGIGKLEPLRQTSPWLKKIGAAVYAASLKDKSPAKMKVEYRFISEVAA